MVIRHLSSVDEMQILASQLAQLVRGGDVLELVGDVGTGKTTFTKALASALGIEEPVQSPTFTISARYELPETSLGAERLVHYDFYRLTDPGVMSAELYEAVNDRGSIVILEWAEVVADVLPADRLTIHFEYLADPSARKVELEARGDRALQLVAGIDK